MGAVLLKNKRPLINPHWFKFPQPREKANLLATCWQPCWQYYWQQNLSCNATNIVTIVHIQQPTCNDTRTAKHFYDHAWPAQIDAFKEYQLHFVQVIRNPFEGRNRTAVNLASLYTSVMIFLDQILVPLTFVLISVTTARATERPEDLFRNTVARTVASHSEGGSVFTSDRSGPLAAVFRVTVGESQLSCRPNATHTCGPATSFGDVGAALYRYEDSERNFEGNSVQHMVACRCLQPNCTTAVHMRPVLVTEVATQRVTKTCVYRMANEDRRFPDCHAQIPHLAAYPRRKAPLRNTPSGGVHVKYAVEDERHGDFWDVDALRGWHYNCTDTEYARLPRIAERDIRTIPASHTSHHHHGSMSTVCRGEPGYTLYRPIDDAAATLCARMHDRAIAAARFRSTQQDCFANAKSRIAYLQPPPIQLVSDADLSLSCSAAVLGLLLLIAMCREVMRKPPSSYWRVARFFALQTTYVALETLPLFVIFGTELAAKRWSTLLAYVDVVRASDEELPKDGGGVLIFIPVIGDIGYNFTRLALVTSVTAVFLFTSIAILTFYIVQISCQVHSGRTSAAGQSLANESIHPDEDKHGRRSKSMYYML